MPSCLNSFLCAFLVDRYVGLMLLVNADSYFSIVYFIVHSHVWGMKNVKRISSRHNSILKCFGPDSKDGTMKYMSQDANILCDK